MDQELWQKINSEFIIRRFKKFSNAEWKWRLYFVGDVSDTWSVSDHATSNTEWIVKFGMITVYYYQKLALSQYKIKLNITEILLFLNFIIFLQLFKNNSTK